MPAVVSRQRHAEIHAEQAHGRRQPQSDADADVEIGDRYVAGAPEDVPRIHEPDAPDPSVDGKAQLLIQDEQAVSASRSKEVRFPERVRRIAANAVATAGEEALAPDQLA